LSDGQRIVEDLQVTIGGDTEGGAFGAWIDERELTMNGTGVALDVTQLGQGPHVLRIRGEYMDGTLPVTRSISFVVAADVTWSRDIVPIYDTQCGACHGAAGPSPTRLDAASDWRTIWPRILDNVRTGRMPLGRPALAPRELALLEAWANSGFPE
jgi:hypothetical protein